MYPGYHGKVLTLDLGASRASTSKLESETVHAYLGGRGLATRLFMDRVDPRCDPLGPDNVLVLAASPLLGTNAPTSCRGHMVFKSPLTGAIGSTNCGGSWAPAFKATGHDALVLEGRAAEPVWIDIQPGKVTFHSASSLWGMDVPATTEALLAEPGADRGTRVLCIGPAGENLVRFAAVMNDRSRAYGRTGPGAVMGSKNIKAVRVTGRLKVASSDPEQYRSGLDQARYMMKAAPITKRLLKELGTDGLLELIDIMDMLPARNFQGNRHDEQDLDRISGETIRRTILQKAAGCHACPIACQRHTRVGDRSGEGPEFETVVLLGPQCGIYDLDAITRANYLCNELGLDTMSFGGTLACAMELNERGRWGTQDSGDGEAPEFGNSGSLEEFVRLTASRQGIGDLLAEGALRLSQTMGCPESAMTVKGLELPAYDPRASYPQALGYMTSPTGACHLRGGYAVSLAFFGGTKEIPRFSLLQSPIAIRNMQNLGIIQDSLGICRFTGFAFSTEPWARMVSGLTGADFSTAHLEEIAERVATLERLFNLRAGFKAEDDTLPDRFVEESIPVEDRDRNIPREAIARMRSDYYSVRGWAEDSGLPLPETLEALNLKEDAP
jgi:aldehyde:ferredoxin oxidoreductase